ncbi:hypothetical protein E5288_WYG000309 [Bos mutus]|uniref:Tomoregulin-2 n=1 Tax=Bos mutus TaxID=72004 RepID=A0A6B0QQ41_9CETA|nr:hypothetical protein [Bos mutus]
MQRSERTQSVERDRVWVGGRAGASGMGILRDFGFWVETAEYRDETLKAVLKDVLYSTNSNYLDLYKLQFLSVQLVITNLYIIRFEFSATTYHLHIGFSLLLFEIPEVSMELGYDDRENDLFLCDTNTCKFDGECLRIGDTVTCVCQFKCNSDYVPVCGSNGESYQNECYLRQAACKQQSEILVVSEGSCATDAGSGSGDGVHEGSGETSQKETSTCDICQFGAECDEDAEDVWCVCNIDCSQTNFNPLCASDGKSYDNACQIKEASCQKQEKIEVMSLGRCQDNTTTTTKSEDGHYARTDFAENANKLEESAREHHIPCPEHYNGFCMHGKCEHSINMQEPSCRCDAGYTGQHCEKKDYSVLYVVPGPVRFQYVLIAAVIGTIQIAVICVVVLCITRMSESILQQLCKAKFFNFMNPRGKVSTDY